MRRTSETAIEDVLLAQGYEKEDTTSCDRERAIFPQVALDFIRTTQTKIWDKLEVLHGERPVSVCWKHCASGWIPMDRSLPFDTASSASESRCASPSFVLRTV